MSNGERAPAEGPAIWFSISLISRGGAANSVRSARLEGARAVELAGERRGREIGPAEMKLRSVIRLFGQKGKKIPMP
jgi:hypothetical protein